MEEDEHTPLAADLQDPLTVQRILSTTYRILRDTRKGRRIKKLYEFKCQICGDTIDLPNGEAYAEAHHIKPLGCHGPDIEENMLCLCPNDHARLDIGAIMLDKSKLTILAGHNIGGEYINYHNEQIHKV
ncbi:HNH endonuclease [Candidatus Poribacteria bacterium]